MLLVQEILFLSVFKSHKGKLVRYEKEEDDQISDEKIDPCSCFKVDFKKGHF